MKQMNADDSERYENGLHLAIFVPQMKFALPVSHNDADNVSPVGVISVAIMYEAATDFDLGFLVAQVHTCKC